MDRFCRCGHGTIDHPARPVDESYHAFPCTRCDCSNFVTAEETQ